MAEENMGPVNQKEVERLISEKLTEAKLDISEKRLGYLIVIGTLIIAVVGVIIPLMSNRSSEKVDNSIQQMKDDLRSLYQRQDRELTLNSDRIDKDLLSLKQQFKDLSQSMDTQAGQGSARVDKAIAQMQTQFKELAGTQLRHPNLECTYKGRSIEGLTIPFEQGDIVFDIRNSGDAPARNTFFRLYINVDCFESGPSNWAKREPSDEPDYKFSFEMTTADWSSSFDPKDSRQLRIGNLYFDYEKPTQSPALLKIFYEQPEPRTYRFTASFNQKK